MRRVFLAFLNHLGDDEQQELPFPVIRLFLNHLGDDELCCPPQHLLDVFLNHLCDEELELSQNKTLNINYISF